MSTGRDRRPLDYTEGNKKYHWHIEIIPRLTEIDGFEWGTGFYINTTSPEEAARILKSIYYIVNSI